jgi:lipoate-protein ligase B
LVKLLFKDYHFAGYAAAGIAISPPEEHENHYKIMREAWIMNHYGDSGLDISSTLLLRRLGLIGVDAAEKRMNLWRELIGRKILPELLLIMSHPPSVTVGVKHGKQERPPGLRTDIPTLENLGIRYVRSIRGGGVTFHWPGQIICYPMIRLSGKERNAPRHMEKLEYVCEKTLSDFNIFAKPRRDTPAHIGLWIGNKKIVSMGVRISGWITMFGFAINLGAFDPRSHLVAPCGIGDAQIITMEDQLGRSMKRALVEERLLANFSEVFNRAITSCDNAAFERVSELMDPYV